MLRVVEQPDPVPGVNDVLIAVEAAGVSRADVMQRMGKYPPPAHHSPIPGLEVAGTVLSTGSAVTGWKTGDRVCALVNGGGYATRAVAAAGQVLPIPENWTSIEASSLPENMFTVYDNLFTRAKLAPGETLLVHGGTSGIGTTAIMLGAECGATVYATAGSDEKCAAARSFGAAEAINYRSTDFVERVAEFTGGAGVNIVLDIVGGDYLARDLRALAFDGRIVCIATSGGNEATINLGFAMQRRATLITSSLRGRTSEQKAQIARKLIEHIWPRLPEKERIKPVIDSTFPLEHASDAHARLESSAHIGKIVLTVS